ncbi:putative nuclease HARBI1 [Tachysurus ichikawai]
MPNTIGVIDCTHVHIQAPHERDWEYINRKGRRSINIQLVGDADLIITNSTTPAQARFNTAHCKTRCAIERLNGVLNACLNYLRVEPQGACNIILACIVLHNITTRHNVPLCDDVYDAPEPVEEPGQPLAFRPNEGLTGRIVRDAIVRHYF